MVKKMTIKTSTEMTIAMSVLWLEAAGILMRPSPVYIIIGPIIIVDLDDDNTSIAVYWSLP